MLDGYKAVPAAAAAAAAVIVGQNWGSSRSAEAQDQRDQEEHEEVVEEEESSKMMVDMIHQQQQGPMEMRIPPLYSLFDRDQIHHQQQQQQQQHVLLHQGFPDHDQSWSRGLHQEESSSSGNYANFRRYQLVNCSSDDEEQQELKMLFPTNLKSNMFTQHLEQQQNKRIQIHHEMGIDCLKDGVGEDLLSLRPPNSAHSGVTTGGSSPDRSSNKQQQQEQKKIDPPLGLELLNMLLECAQAVNAEDLDTALGLLSQLKQGASVYGDSMQRLTAHFSEGLAARILRISPRVSPAQAEFLRSLILGNHARGTAGGTAVSDYLGAFTALYTVSPYFKLAHFTANQAILEAVDGHDRVHVIDLDIMQGLQWPSFIQALASRRRPPSLLTITGLGPDRDALHDTGNRLASFAAGFELPFRFRPVAVPPGEVPSEGLLSELAGEDDTAALAVNAVFRLHRLLGVPRGLERFLAALRRVQPVAVTVVEQEAAHNAPGFIARFVEALHYYAAVFDSLDASLPQRNEERVRIEQAMFARQIRNIVSCEGEERVERHERMEYWTCKMSECGFVQLPMSSHSLSQAKLLLQLCPCDGYRLAESPSASASQVGSLSLGWQDRLLLTASSWACNPHF